MNPRKSIVNKDLQKTLQMARQHISIKCSHNPVCHIAMGLLSDANHEPKQWDKNSRIKAASTELR
jgi:hypothetical protein